MKPSESSAHTVGRDRPCSGLGETSRPTREGPLIYLDDAREYPLVMGLYAFQTRHGIKWNLMMAASLAVAFPIIVLFFIAQRYFIEGIALTGLKG